MEDINEKEQEECDGNEAMDIHKQPTDVLSEEDLDALAENMLVAITDESFGDQSDDEEELQKQMLSATREQILPQASEPPQRRLPNYRRVTVDLSSVYDYQFFIAAAKHVYGDKSL